MLAQNVGLSGICDAYAFLFPAYLMQNCVTLHLIYLCARHSLKIYRFGIAVHMHI